MMEPLIKWTGSKKSQANEIISHFPKEIDTYYTMMWEALKKIDDIEGKKEFYEKLMDKYNEGKDPYDFMVLNRLYDTLQLQGLKKCREEKEKERRN